MPRTLQFKFDANQDYQLEAIAAVVDLFEGLSRHASEFALGDEAIANLPRYETLDETWLHENLVAVQRRNGIPQDNLLPELAVDEGLVLERVGNESWRYPSFTVEMETGTGKTYVYLRTIHELRKRYGFRKFIVVVPSIAIYEGVVKNFQVTRSHMAALYGNETVNLIRYDGSRLSQLRSFASSTFVEIMVMTLAAFNGVRNVLYRASESLPGERLPHEYIQVTRPILILDEPQNMESERSEAALRTLHPLFALRYSATHRSTPNLVYRLTPFDAYQRNLVKKIQVDGVTERENFNLSFRELEKITRQGGRLTALVRTIRNDRGRPKERVVALRQGDDLAPYTLAEESGPYIVSEIHAGEGYLEFTNGERLRLHEQIGPTRPEVFCAQIRSTIKEHMERQHQLLPLGVKVLSLFFIDRVANYIAPDGIIRRIFDEEFERLKGNYPHYANWEPGQVRNAYFAQRKIKGSDQEEAVDTPIEEQDKKAADRMAEQAAFTLIMRDKERLLSLDEPVSFIFAHSALKEGWDNPNVFQICTLNQTASEMKKRQEIGRGLRLAVNQDGERVHDADVNVLTVVANESYEHYVSRLQSEYEEAGQNAPPKPTRAHQSTARRNDAVYRSKLFREFWERVSQRAEYVIHVDTPTLIELCVERLANDKTPLKPVIVVGRGAYVVTEYRIKFEDLVGQGAKLKVESSSTAGARSLFERTYKKGDDLSKLHKDERLRGYRIVELANNGASPVVTFDNGQQLALHQTLSFHSEAGQVPQERVQIAPDETYPVPNLLDRAARETGLTRPTLNRIYGRLSERKRVMLLKNPEGFASWFITVVRNALADHIVDNLEFVITGGGEPLNLDTLFPETKPFPQKELVSGGGAALYDQVQVDSDVEKRFVENRLCHDDLVECYFKFPPSFTVKLPKVVGSYNPDWGILRWSDDGKKLLLQLVRETKGSEELDRLRFPHEKRKVKAATSHFREVAVDYRKVTDKTVAWWDPEEGEQTGL